MANRYTVLNKQQETKLLKGCPVLIDAIGITKDEKTGQVLAQVKLQNLSPKAIIGCKIRIEAFQISKEPLEGVDSFSYLDMTVKQGEFFGNQTPIKLPDNRTRQIKVSVSDVVFEDQAIWKYETGEWETLPSQDILFPNDDELLKEYTLEVGGNVRLEPEIWNGFFLCTCGTINLEGQACYKCKRTYEALLSPLLNEEVLRENAKERQKEVQYQEGLRLKEKQNLEDVEKAKGIFASLVDFKDAIEQSNACQRKIEEIKAKEEADRLEREHQAEERRIAAEKAAKKRRRAIAITTPIVVGCAAFVLLLITVIIPKQKLNKAVTLIDSGDYEAAYILLDEIRNASIIYNKAMALIDSGDYETAYILLEEIGNNDAIASSKYDRAMALIDSGDYEAAYMLLDGLNYKDSAEKLISVKLHYQLSLFSEAQVGSYVCFGAYEQDNNKSNGKEDIEWLVLAKEGEKVLIISKYALDCQPYNKDYRSVIWERCSLRAWLNGDFLTAAFSPEEQSIIISSSITADKNPEYGTSAGNDTTDKVFLLSITESDCYFQSEGARRCAPTDYAITQGVWASNSHNTDGRATCWWWLRSPGNYGAAAFVGYDGLVSYYGGRVDRDNIAVRPALWINLGS